MKNAIYALVLAPVVALAAPAAEPPALRLNVDSLMMTVPRIPGADCPARIATISVTEVGRPGTFWASQRVAAPVQHNQTQTCAAVVGFDQWAGKLREGQRLTARATIADRRSASLDLVVVCGGSAGCTLADASGLPPASASNPVSAFGDKVAAWLKGGMQKPKAAKPEPCATDETMCPIDDVGTVGADIKPQR